jgi:indole-3-glycerol phosphate synthase
MEIVLEKYNITSTNSVINTNSTLIGVNQTINLASNLDAVTKQQLKEQIDTLQAQLHEIGQTKKEDVEAIVKAAKVLVDEASSAQPNKKHVKNLAEGLKSAAEGIASVMPTVMKIVKIVFQVVGITLV